MGKSWSFHVRYARREFSYVCTCTKKGGGRERSFFYSSYIKIVSYWFCIFPFFFFLSGEIYYGVIYVCMTSIHTNMLSSGYVCILHTTLEEGSKLSFWPRS